MRFPSGSPVTCYTPTNPPPMTGGINWTDLSGINPIIYNNVTGAFSFQNPYYTTGINWDDLTIVGTSPYLTGNQSITWTGSGDVSGTASGTTSISPSLTLGTTGIAAGTYNNLTVDTKGRATSGSTVAYLTSEVDTLDSVTGRGATTANAVTIGTGTVNGNLTVSGNLGVGTTAPTNALHVRSSGGITNDGVGVNNGGCDSQTSLLVHGYTNANDSNCNGGGAKAPTTSGTVTYNSAVNFLGYNGAITTADANAYVSYPNSSDFLFGSGDFAIEFMVRFVTLPTAVNNVARFIYLANGASQRSYSLYLSYGSPNMSLSWSVSSDGSNYTLQATSTWNPSVGVNYHVVIYRISGKDYLAVNGVVLNAGGSTDSVNYYASTSAFKVLGDSVSGGTSVLGSMGEVRVSKGNGRFSTSGFTPPSIPYGITPANSNFIFQSNDSQVAKIWVDANNLNAFDIDVNGGSRVTVGTTGSVGLSTTTPKNTLDVFGSQAIGTTFAGTFSAPANGLIVAGNVGVGTSTPSARLHVYTTSESAPNFTGSAQVQIQSTSTNIINAGLLSGAPYAGFIQVGGTGNSSYPLVLNPKGGNVGIGTVAPLSALEIIGAGTTSATNTLNVMSSAKASSFLVRDDKVVGIGTTNPGASLEINASAASNDAVLIRGNSTSNKYALNIISSLGGGQEVTRLQNTNAGGLAAFVLVNDANNLAGFGASGTTLGAPYSSNLVFYTGTAAVQDILFLARRSDANIRFYTGGSPGTERMRIDYSGNVGIGSTAPAQKLDVNGTVNATGYQAGATPGFNGTCGTTAVTSITVANGIITGCSGI